MKLLRSATAIGIAKTVYDQARKPENQARIKDAVEKLRASSAQKKGQKKGQQKGKKSQKSHRRSR
jgi:hypothetical protein